MPRTEAQKRAKKKYELKAKRLNITIYPSESDILQQLSAKANECGYAPYIKQLIREDIVRSKNI